MKSCEVKCCGMHVYCMCTQNYNNRKLILSKGGGIGIAARNKKVLLDTRADRGGCWSTPSNLHEEQ